MITTTLLSLILKNPQIFSPWSQFITPSNSPPLIISHGNSKWKPFWLVMTFKNSLMALILLLWPQSPQIMKSNWISNIKHGFVKINSFLVLWSTPSRRLSFPSSLNPKPLVRPGKPWPTSIFDLFVVTSNKSKNNLNRHPRDLSQSPNTCKSLKFKSMNLLHLANCLTMKISLRKSWRILMMIINP